MNINNKKKENIIKKFKEKENLKLAKYLNKELSNLEKQIEKFPCKTWKKNSIERKKCETRKKKQKNKKKQEKKTKQNKTK